MNIKTRRNNVKKRIVTTESKSFTKDMIDKINNCPKTLLNIYENDIKKLKNYTKSDTKMLDQFLNNEIEVKINNNVNYNDALSILNDIIEKQARLKQEKHKDDYILTWMIFPEDN